MPNDYTLTPKQAYEEIVAYLARFELTITQDAVYKSIKRNKISGIKLPGGIRVSRSSVKEYVKARRV